MEKVKRGRIVAVRDPKTIEVLDLRVGYIKDRFGKLCRQDIKPPDVLAFMRSYEAEGNVVEMQLADLDNSTVEGLSKKHGPLALIGSRTKLMQQTENKIGMKRNSLAQPAYRAGRDSAVVSSAWRAAAAGESA